MQPAQNEWIFKSILHLQLATAVAVTTASLRRSAAAACLVALLASNLASRSFDSFLKLRMTKQTKMAARMMTRKVRKMTQPTLTPLLWTVDVLVDPEDGKFKEWNFHHMTSEKDIRKIRCNIPSHRLR